MPLLKVIPALIALSLPALALAQPYPGGYPGGWAGGGRAQRVGTQGGAEPSRQIDVETFRSVDAGDQLGKGRIVVSDAPPRPKHEHDSDASTIVVTGDPDAKLPVYEAAVIDQLAGKGYDISHYADPAQFVEVTISSDVVIPEEAPHKPVSGEMSVGVSNHGSGYGLALAVDLSKPAKAILATRMDVRIRDKATRRVLWEGYAQGQSRATENGSDGIDDTRMATRLAVALFARFPDGKVVQQADLPTPPSQSSGGE
jgi:hypothetical protein